MKFLLPLLLFYTSITFSQETESRPPIPPPPPATGDTTEVDSVDMVFMKVETMPHYQECINENSTEQNSCTNQKIVQYVAQNFVVPDEAIEKGISGRILVSFVVNKEGKIEEVTIIQGLHNIVDNEAIRVVQSIPDMVPGEQLGKNVKVRYVIPITVRPNFKKDKKKKKKKS